MNKVSVQRGTVRTPATPPPPPPWGFAVAPVPVCPEPHRPHPGRRPGLRDLAVRPDAQTPLGQWDDRSTVGRVGAQPSLSSEPGAGSPGASSRKAPGSGDRGIVRVAEPGAIGGMVVGRHGTRRPRHTIWGEVGGGVATRTHGPVGEVIFDRRACGNPLHGSTHPGPSSPRGACRRSARRWRWTTWPQCTTHRRQSRRVNCFVAVWMLSMVVVLVLLLFLWLCLSCFFVVIFCFHFVIFLRKRGIIQSAGVFFCIFSQNCIFFTHNNAFSHIFRRISAQIYF